MQIYLKSLALILIFETILFIVAYFVKRNDLADVGWGLGFGVVAIFNFVPNTEPTHMQKVLLIVVLAWSLRLAGYLGFRMIGKSEDQRYQDMRAGWKSLVTLKSFLYIFILQGFLLWILAGPIIYYFSEENLVVSNLSWLAIFFSLFGLVYESIADLQKSAFKKIKANSSTFIQTGLFKYSRYPQYFGEIIFWTGVALFPMSINIYLGFLYAPIFLFILLRFVSGVPLLEKKYITRTGYSNYATKTPLFFPRIF